MHSVNVISRDLWLTTWCAGSSKASAKGLKLLKLRTGSVCRTPCWGPPGKSECGCPGVHRDLLGGPRGEGTRVGQRSEERAAGPNEAGGSEERVWV